MRNWHLSILVLCAAGGPIVGCDGVGQTPPGGSDAEIKATLDRMPVEERVKILMASPAPQAQKLQQIKDLYQKAGKPVPDDVARKLGAPSAH